MSDSGKRRGLGTTIAVAAFALVTAALLIPGYLNSALAKPPTDARFYVDQAFERRTRVFAAETGFGRLPGGAKPGAVLSFDCARSAIVRREFGWRGAREVIFDCATRFEDTEGQGYAWVFRLIPDDDPAADPSPEGYRTLQIDAAEARDILERLGWMP